MRISLLFIFITALSFSQEKDYIITKKNGTALSVKGYFSKAKYLKLKLKNENTQELPYSQLDKIEYEIKNKRKIEKITKQFIRTSKNKGFLMTRIAEGNCNAYSITEASGGGSSTTYYVKKNNEQIATRIGSRDLVVVYNYKKIALKYFEDCPKVITKIKKKFKRKKIKELVEFYNANCL